MMKNLLGKLKIKKKFFGTKLVNRKLFLTIGLLIYLIGQTTEMKAAPANLDPTFGSGGKVQVSIGTEDRGNAIVLQPDGKIVVGGTANGGAIIGNFALARYLGDPAIVPRNKAFDYDGDGKSDISAFRPSNGVWYLQQSTNGFNGIQFGAESDRIVPADYDADGKTDLAVFRPSNGVWYLQRSTQDFTGIQFGASGDIPVPADYDADGRADLAVFRPSNGVWYLNRSTQGFTGVSFGANGDKPVPNAFTS